MWYAVVFRDIKTGKEDIITFNQGVNYSLLVKVRDGYIADGLLCLCYIRVMTEAERSIWIRG